MKKPSFLLSLACFLFLAAASQARLDETVQEIEARYGKTLKGVKPEYPATVAGLYHTNGFLITVGFYQNKSYYERFQKLDPKKPGSIQQINDDERVALLTKNCKGTVVVEPSSLALLSIGLLTLWGASRRKQQRT